jgi:glutaredoxin
MVEKQVPIHKNPWIWGAVVVVVLVVFLSITSASGPGDLDTFATCLADSGAAMYGTDWCPHCADQKALFGGSFKKVNYINCDFDEEACLRNRVTGYPTWVINGENQGGVQPLETLSALTGCPLVRDE